MDCNQETALKIAEKNEYVGPTIALRYAFILYRFKFDRMHSVAKSNSETHDVNRSFAEEFKNLNSLQPAVLDALMREIADHHKDKIPHASRKLL